MSPPIAEALFEFASPASNLITPPFAGSSPRINIMKVLHKLKNYLPVALE